MYDFCDVVVNAGRWGSITELWPQWGNLFLVFVRERRVWLKHACWRGGKNQISWCTLVSRRRAQGTPLEWSFIRCLCQVYGIQRGLGVWMCVYAYVRAYMRVRRRIDFPSLIPPIYFSTGSYHRQDRKGSQVLWHFRRYECFWHCAHFYL